MGKTGNKARKRRYAREPQGLSDLLKRDMQPTSQEEVEMSYPSESPLFDDIQQDDELARIADRVKRITAGEPVLPDEEDTALTVELVKPKKHRVSIMGDHRLEFPELYGSVYIAGDRHEQRNFAEIMARSRITKAQSAEDADFVIFTGGPDVDPQLYGQRSIHPECELSPQRDEADIVLYLHCVQVGIPMVGICRGAQFLHVMNGGSLYQHVDNHNKDHHMWDRDAKICIDHVSSVHHQACIPNDEHGMHVIATAGGSKTRWLNAELKEEGGNPDIEAFFYRDTVCLGIQGHPEYRGYNYFAFWTMEKIRTFIFESPDCYYDEGGRRRLKPELIEQRNEGLGISTIPSIQVEENL